VREELHDPAAFAWLEGCLERLDDDGAAPPGPAFAFAAFLGLVRILGFSPRFDECAACGRPAPAGKSAWFAFDAGGIVCSRCGGKGTLIDARTRRFIAAAARLDDLEELADMPAEMAAAARDARELLYGLIDRIASGLSGKDRSYTAILRAASTSTWT
jgi:DNA repair protein RecO